MTSLILSIAQPQHFEHLARWFTRQERTYGKFSPAHFKEWLNEEDCLVLNAGSELAGFLMHARTSPHAAIITGLAVADGWDLDQVLTPLLSAALQAAHQDGIAQFKCVTSADWLIPALTDDGFQRIDCLASYMKNGPATPRRGNGSILTRPAAPPDLSALVEVDAASFEPLWQEEARLLSLSLQRSTCFVVAETTKGIVGYAAGSAQSDHAHISRLAVRPESQGQGIGTRLLAEIIACLHGSGARYFTLNTQADNAVSRHLYEHFGFQLLNCDAQILVKRLRTDRVRDK